MSLQLVCLFFANSIITNLVFSCYFYVCNIGFTMILLDYYVRSLSYKVNRWANIIASIITITFVIGGGSLYLHYIFFASMEVICMLMIIWYSWKWK
ncbi:DUF6326 family protein [Acetobacterium sp.]|uniref:DUF6326 family protein n=1 Tax=Acetobacterium sp. TaxID=1872094 RepID=UPI0035936323